MSPLVKKSGSEGTWKGVLGFLILLISLFHVLIVTAMVSENSDNSSIIFATNNDASVAITVATQTRWFNDNGWRPYGPLYYRLAHSLSGLVPYYKAQSAIPQEENQVNHHFSLMLVSLGSLLLACLFIAGLFELEGPEKIGVASLFLSLFLLNRTFSRYVLVAHPDFLLTFFTVLLFFSAYRFLKNPTKMALTLIGVTFGLMLSTKISAILFLPGIFCVLLYSSGWLGKLKNLINFGLVSTATYFLVGYPQNFKIQETLDFLNTYSQHSKIADAGSIAEWITLFAHQFWMPLSLSFILFALVGKRQDGIVSDEKRLKFSGRIVLFSLGLFPLLALMSRQFNSPHDYYTIPFGILFLMVLSALACEGLRLGFLLRFSLVRKMVLLLVIPLLAVRSNTHFASIVKEETANRNSYREIQSWIAEKARQGETVLLTSYVPMPYESTGIMVDSDYTFEKLKGINYSAMALNKLMYSRYLVGEQPSDYVLVDFKKRDWRPVRSFFNFFYGGVDVKTPDGREWHMVGERCDIQLWQVKSPIEKRK